MNTTLKDEPSEFEVQAVAYILLKPHFPIVRGECVLRMGDRTRRSIRDAYQYKSRGVRADIALFDSNSVLKMIVEVKRKEDSTAQEQGVRYKIACGVPVLYIRGMKQAEDALVLVQQCMKDNEIEIR
jgi:hypothetical protein